MSDPHNLERFFQAQEHDHARALNEIRGGRKVTHWMWYVFPQIAGLGSSDMATRYAIRSLDEAKAYLAHPVLGPRLVECAEAVLGAQGRSAYDIFGPPDDLKLKSSATLFERAAGEGSVFGRVLDRYFGGERDPLTLRILNP